MAKVKFNWAQQDAGLRAAMPDNVALYATPNHIKFGKPARKTAWRAGASVWDETTRTMNRFGADVYGQQCANKADAMRLAESVYLAAINANAAARLA